MPDCKHSAEYKSNESTMNNPNPYQITPQVPLTEERSQAPLRYAGFWIRFAAFVIDSILQVIVTLPLLWAIYGPGILDSTEYVNGAWEVVISYILPFILYIFCWVRYGGTPGKRLLGIRLLNEKTGEHVSIGVGVLRYVGFFISAMILFLGFVWVALDKKKKGLHDHIASTVVVFD